MAQYILEHEEQVCKLTINELASVTNTSPASIIRFSKKLGYSGFQELKISLAKDIAEAKAHKEKIYEEITIYDNIDEIIEKIAIGNISAVRDTIKLLNKNIIKKATEAIITANKINLFGVGSSYLVAADFYYKLVRVNIPAIIHMDPHLQVVSALNMDRNGTAIGISHSGKTTETYKALEAAKKAGATTLSITKLGNNPISNIADINIYTTEVEKGVRMGAIASRVAQLTVTDILFMNIVKKNYDKMLSYILKTDCVIRGQKIKLSEIKK